MNEVPNMDAKAVSTGKQNVVAMESKDICDSLRQAVWPNDARRTWWGGWPPEAAGLAGPRSVSRVLAVRILNPLPVSDKRYLEGQQESANEWSADPTSVR